MKLLDYDGQCVRITVPCGDIFEGICRYSDKYYNEHEYGRREEALRIINHLFFKNDIKEIESLEGHNGSYGKFSSCYGLIEELNVQDGIDFIRDVLFCEENEHVYRMLLCLEHHLSPRSENGLDCYDEVIETIHELLQTDIEPDSREKARQIIGMWG